MKIKIGSLVAAQLALTSMTALAADGGIHVDQVGYLRNHQKIAMVSSEVEDGANFRLVDVRTGDTVFTGKLSAAKYDEMSGENIREADFSAFNASGTYRLWVGGLESYEFQIGDNVYSVATVQNLRSYTLSRCNNPLSDSITGLVIKKGHPQDKRAILHFGDALNAKGERLDVSGGWYDAGDYGKYTTTAAISTAELMLSYEANPSHFTRGQLFFPKGVKAEGKLPDLLSEVKYELDWMQKMQRADGSTFHKVAGSQWPGFDISPDTDTQDRYIYNTCSAATALSTAPTLRNCWQMPNASGNIWRKRPRRFTAHMKVTTAAPVLTTTKMIFRSASGWRRNFLKLPAIKFTKTI